MLYIVKIYTRQTEEEKEASGKSLRLWDAKLFKNYEYAVGAIISGDPELYENLPEKYRATDFSRPHIDNSCSTNIQAFPCDLEFLYEDTGLVVYIGEPLVEDCDEPETNCAKALKKAMA